MHKAFKNNEMVSGVRDMLNERMGSAMYGTFAISWCLTNWKALFITFFVSQQEIYEKTLLLKNEYLLSLYPLQDKTDILFFALKIFIIPSALSYIFIWQLPKLEFIFFRQHYSNKINKEEEVYKQQKKLLNLEKKLLEDKEKNVELEKNIQVEMTDEQKWNIEYEDSKKDEDFKESLRFLQESIYGHHGWYENITMFNYQLDKSQYIAILDVNGLITFSSNNRNQIIATEKGKYFLKKIMNKK